jgi:hypothetical protein
MQVEEVHTVVTRFRHRRAPVVLSVLALAAALTLSACGSFDSKASGENLIKKWVPDKLDKVSGQPIKLTSVSCPSGVKATAGNTYDCKLTLANTASHKSQSGTITIHITKNQVVIKGGSDLHGFS